MINYDYCYDGEKALNLMKGKTVTQITTFHHPFDSGVTQVYFYLDDGSFVSIGNKVPGPSFIIYGEPNESN
jgi:hypothetical protein